MNLDYKQLIPIKGDASFRRFYRKKNKKKNTVIVYAKKEKSKNLLNYDSINQLLIKNKISAPRLISENFKKNYIEIEDFGNKTLFDILKQNRSQKFYIYKKILSVLKKIQNIKVRKIKNFKKKYYKIPIYSQGLLFKESGLFLDWYIPKIFKRKKKNKVKYQLEKIIKSLIKKLQLPNNVFVHRDFHVSNLMFHKKNISLIDSQDAVYGNLAYDLASLIDDVRLKTNKKTKEMIYNQYIYINKKKINKKKFQNDFEILSVLRNLKIIGIFTRLSIRDKKNQYLRLIPHAWRLIELRIKDKKIFEDLKNILDHNFPKKTRTKK